MKTQFERNGFCTFSTPELSSLADDLYKNFEEDFKGRFTENPDRNRNLLKRFANAPITTSLFTSSACMEFLTELGIRKPVFCGPLVSHYTAHDHTGGGFGLPFHQDFPSMVSADASVILWLSLTEVSKSTHGLEIVPGGHRKGQLPGTQEAGGYVLSDQEQPEAEILDVAKGVLVAMHPWLPHRTFISPHYTGWKLSLSQRFDDLECDGWASRNFQNAYSTTVNRDLFNEYEAKGQND